MPKYIDLAEAVEDLKKKGYENIFEPDSSPGKWKNLYEADDLSGIKIDGSWFFDMGTDPGDEASIYALQTEDGRKGYVVISFGMNVDRDKAAFLDKLLRTKK